MSYLPPQRSRPSRHWKEARGPKRGTLERQAWEASNDRYGDPKGEAFLRNAGGKWRWREQQRLAYAEGYMDGWIERAGKG